MTKKELQLQTLRDRYRQGGLSASEYVYAVSKIQRLDCTRQSIMRKVQKRFPSWASQSAR